MNFRENYTMSVQQIYDNFKSDLEKKIPKLDPNLTQEMLYLQNKLQNDKNLQRYKDEYKQPFAEFYIKYKDNVDLDNKIESLRKDRNLKSTTTDSANQVFVANRMSIDDFIALTEDPDVQKIIGKASPIIRA